MGEVSATRAQPSIEDRFSRIEHVPELDPDHESDPASAQRVTDQINHILGLVKELDLHRSQDDQSVMDAFSGQSPGLQRWRDSIPSAAALWPLYHASRGTLHDGHPLDEIAQGFFRHCLDARGIRSRGSVTTSLLAAHIAARSDGRALRWASLACGAAEAVCPVVADARRAGLDVTVELVDRDPLALELSMRTAESTGCTGAIRTRELDILDLGGLIDTLGESRYDLVDILGFFEYLPTVARTGWVSAAEFLQVSYRLLAPGGQLIMANMLDTHPQLPFTLHSVRWPYIQPRSLNELADIAGECGIRAGQIDLFLPADGVYAVLAITKPQGDSG